jgi:tRNA(fMet)-specific endonuclease VapC
MARDVVLDTGVLIAFERGRLHPRDVVRPSDNLAISAVTASELLVGVELAPAERVDAKRATVETILQTVEVLDYDLRVARMHALLMAQACRAGQPRGAFDLAVAATALASRRTLITTDGRALFDALPR